MAIEVVPAWMEQLDDEDVTFIKKFILASGSLKEVAGVYGVTYPARPADPEDRTRRAGRGGAVYCADQAPRRQR